MDNAATTNLDNTTKAVPFDRRNVGNNSDGTTQIIAPLGVYNIYINGHLPSDECMAPGWTSYQRRLAYRTLDVGQYLELRPGARNMIAAEVGEGWFAGTLGFRGGTRYNYGGKELSLFAQLEITHDPNEQPWRLVTDDSWECTPSPVINSELYNGGAYDHRLECDGWNRITSEELKVGCEFVPYAGGNALEHGELGSRPLNHAHAQTAQPQLAYRMLCEKSCPSWMYPVTMGATTVWERWNSMLPDGSVNPGRMTSFNHYALGAVADWLHGTVGGIAPMASSPGWKVFRVKPIPGGNVT
ncbi:alpha-L-rhamnosidase [Fusarium denticulatum]|uniref:alpha-L-rhamnosidase n=1 Tax=Fusarium denticulatum TaxID=48507 RepID=A0A8H5U7K8_9HYPO|nr:alpha-L-rhamnosidase [Fusarium denticulatum]